ncbi:MAG: hypothetical protein IT270_04215, partial [Saprospiraceae bacterium]|nr:hypothetical protein [Saprospiraceae bacterium]
MEIVTFFVERLFESATVIAKGAFLTETTATAFAALVRFAFSPIATTAFAALVRFAFAKSALTTAFATYVGNANDKYACTTTFA